MTRASSWEKVMALRESFRWARWRRPSGKPPASPQRKMSSRVPRSRSSPSHLARAFESRLFPAASRRTTVAARSASIFLRAAGASRTSDFHGARAADALHIVVEDGAHFRTAGFAEHEQAEFHFKPYFLRFSRSVLRLMPRASAERLI